jgi:cysteine synthase B
MSQPVQGQRSRISVEAPPAPESVTPAILGLIGNTPLLALTRLARGLPGVRLFAKAEWFNPGGSVKDRAALAIVTDAERRGLIRPGKRLLDASSGNTAVAYAMIGKAKGYPVTLCVPKNANAQVQSILRSYGAELVLTNPLESSDGAIREARRLAAAEPDRFVYLDQYSNPANWQAHYRTTAIEIWQQTQQRVTHFVAGLGTTGTFTGTARRLKALNPRVHVAAVQPDAPFHGLEGMKHLETALVPSIYDATLPDETIFMSTDEAYQMARRLIDEEGLLVGPSSGAAAAASLRLARRLSDAGTPATIVMMFPDSGARYAAEGLYDSSSPRTRSRDPS